MIISFSYYTEREFSHFHFILTNTYLLDLKLTFKVIKNAGKWQLVNKII